MLQNPRETIISLSELFPKAFFDEPRLRRPLKKNIVDDILALNLSELGGLEIQSAVEWYTSHYGYHKGMAYAGAQRIDLDGRVCGTVTATEAQFAVESINRINSEKSANGYANPHHTPSAAIVQERVMAKPIAPAAPPLTDSELLDRATRKLARVRPIIDGDDEDGLRADTAAPLLKSIHEDVKNLWDRLR